MKKVNLSELNDDVLIAREDSIGINTVGELKHEITILKEPHHERYNWFTVVKKKWKPCALSMLTDYVINHYESGEMYEGWDERAIECLTDENVKKVQMSLDEVFKGDDTTVYFEPVAQINIDIHPKID